MAKPEFFTVVFLAVFTRLLWFSLTFLLGLGDSYDASVSALLSFPDSFLEFLWSSSILIVLFVVVVNSPPSDKIFSEIFRLDLIQDVSRD